MQRISSCSFDVFDTCLVRRIGRPQDLFYLLGQRLFLAAGTRFTDDDVHEFVRERVEAERRARRNCAAEDLLLSDIYAHYLSPSPFDFDALELMKAELDIEREFLLPVPEMADHIRARRGEGKVIFFITDMFLPGSFIGGLLSEYGFMEPGDSLYVSGEVGLTKHSGNLFRYVLEKQGLAPEDLLHMGDNKHSDVAVPRAIGIHTRHFGTTCLTPLELVMLGDDGRTCPVRSCLAGAARIVRLRSAGGSINKFLATVVADVAAPMVTGFVVWVLEQARARGIKRLWFVARDGQVMHRVAQELRGGKGPEICYLYGSRQAWFLPSIIRFQPWEHDWLFVSGHSARPDAIVAKLGCSPEEVEEAAGCTYGPFWKTPLEVRERSRLLNILSSNSVRNLVEKKAMLSRKNLIGYLRQEGVSDGEPLVLVDVGWTLKTQQALRRVLIAAGMDCPVSGFYLGISQSALTASSAGRYQAYFLERDNWFDPTQPMNFFFRNANIVEQIFTAATHEQTVGYTHDGEQYIPVLRKDGRNGETLAAVYAMQELILEFAREIAHVRHGDVSGILRAINLEGLRSFLGNPQPELARALSTFPSFDDQNETRQRKIAHPISLSLLLQAVLLGTAVGKRFARPEFSNSFDWVEGSVALSPRWLQRTLRIPFVDRKLKKLRKSL